MGFERCMGPIGFDRWRPAGGGQLRELGFERWSTAHYGLREMEGSRWRSAPCGLREMEDSSLLTSRDGG